MSVSLSLRPSSRRGKVRGWVFYALLLFSVGVGFVLLGTLLVDVFQKGVQLVDSTMLTKPNSSLPERAGAGPAIRGTIYIWVSCS